MEPPSEEEIAEYGAWLGLQPEDSDLIWIAKQALQTAIPTPWIECATEDGDVFYYNTKTKESVWDHPYDSYYKAVIRKYKTGKCTKEQLMGFVSEPWLVSSTDERESHQPPSEFASSPRGSPQTLKLSISGDPAGPDRSDAAMEVEGGSPVSPARGRRRTSEHSSVKSTARRSPGGSPGLGYSSKFLEKQRLQTPVNCSELEVQRLRESLAIAESECAGAKMNLVRLAADSESAKTHHKAEAESMTRDLIKSREYIDLLVADNHLLRSRMAEAASRLGQLKGLLSTETRRREESEIRVMDLEDRVRELEIEMPTQKNLPILSRLCGSSNSSIKPKQHVVYRAPRPLTMTNKNTQDQTYKELMNLLTPTSPPRK